MPVFLFNAGSVRTVSCTSSWVTVVVPPLVEYTLVRVVWEIGARLVLETAEELGTVREGIARGGITRDVVDTDSDERTTVGTPLTRLVTPFFPVTATVLVRVPTASADKATGVRAT